eukprot:3493918-Ditylum_brightwellii.AAC.1
MPLIHDFLSLPKHFRETLYTIKYLLCGKDDYNIANKLSKQSGLQQQKMESYMMKFYNGWIYLLQTLWTKTIF